MYNPNTEEAKRFESLKYALQIVESTEHDHISSFSKITDDVIEAAKKIEGYLFARR